MGDSWEFFCLHEKSVSYVNSSTVTKFMPGEIKHFNFSSKRVKDYKRSYRLSRTDDEVTCITTEDLSSSYRARSLQ